MKPAMHALALGCALATVLTFVPSDLLAQGRPTGRVAQPRGTVAVARPRNTVVLRSYYRPFFYDPWLYGPYYRPFFYGGAFGYPYYGNFGHGNFGYGGYGGAFGGPFGLNASLRLQVTPRETEVFVDGYLAGIVDNFDGVFQRLRLEPGEHTLELYLPGHRSVQQRLYLQPGATTNIRERMIPIGPADAEPVRPEGLAPPPRSAIETPIPTRPPAGPTREPLANDRTALPSGYGEIALRVMPADAEVFVDGQRWNAPAADQQLVIQAGVGVHHIEVRRSGFRTYLSDLNVREGQSTSVNISLTPQ